MKREKTPFAYFFSQPHQPFFAWGVLHAIVVMTLFLLLYKGGLTAVVSPNFFHAQSLIFIVFTSFFQGFLLTTFPRFSQMPPLEQKTYMTNFTLLVTGTLLSLTGAFLSLWLLLFGMLVLVANQSFSFYLFYRIYRVSPSPDKYDQFWILTAFGSGVVAHLVLVLSLFGGGPLLEEGAKKSAIYLYLIFVAFAVGQRMIPFFSHVMIAKNRMLLKVCFMLFGAAIVTDLLFGNFGFIFLAAASVLIGREVLRWKLPYRNAEPILWILHLAIFWLPTGLLLGAVTDFAGWIVERDLYFLSIHLVAIGFVTTVLIGFGTRVTLGHSGNQMVTDKYTKMLFYMTQIVLYMRILYSLTGTPFLFDISAGLWILLFGGWALKYMPALLLGREVR